MITYSLKKIVSMSFMNFQSSQEFEEKLNMDNSDTDLNVEFDFEFDSRPGTPTEIVEAAAEADKQLLPLKSKDRYNDVYKNYQKWKELTKVNSNSERVILAYFSQMANIKTKNNENTKASTLWARYSMLRSTMAIFDGVDISTYAKVIAFLKRKSEGYEAKKAKTFNEQQIQNFLDGAPDVVWLDVKVVCVFCMFGCSRTHELPTIRMSDIDRGDDVYFVTVPRQNTKTNKENVFAIRGPMLDIVRRYENLRPAHTTSDRFFLNYQKGKCTVQVIGKAKFYKMPRRIAEYLKLADMELYTGHSFKRTSTTIYANTGASIEAIKRHTGHSSTKVCEGYIEESRGYKKKAADAIMMSINCGPSTSSAASSHRNIAPAIDNIIDSSDVIQSFVSTNEISNVNHSIEVDTTMNSSRKQVTMRTDEIEGVNSQNITSSQVSTQNFLAQMDKRMVFYKCENININFK